MGKIRIRQIGEGFEGPKKIKKIKKVEKTPKVDKTAGETPEVKTVQQEVKPEKSSQEKVEIKKEKVVQAHHKHGRSKRYKAFDKKAKESQSLNDAIKLVKKTATTKFDETIEVHLNLLETGLRVKVAFPHSFGSKRKVLILSSNNEDIEKITAKLKTETMKSLVIQTGGEKEINEIQKAATTPNVSEIWATQDIMPKVAKIARILGPTGLMPNPKRETVIKDSKMLEEKLKSLAKGTVFIESESKAPLLHAIVAKASMKEKEIEENLKALLTAVGEKNIQKITLCSTMGPGINIRIK